MQETGVDGVVACHAFYLSGVQHQSPTGFGNIGKGTPARRAMSSEGLALLVLFFADGLPGLYGAPIVAEAHIFTPINERIPAKSIFQILEIVHNST